MKVGIVTSEKSVSLQRVAHDIRDVLLYNNIKVKRMIYSPNADPSLYRDLDAVIIVMTFDTFWAVGYFLICYNVMSKGKKCIFYTTVEGDPIRYQGDDWIYRELKFIANSEFTKERLQLIGAEVTKVIHHGIDVHKIYQCKFMRNLYRGGLGLKDDDFMVLYIAGAYMRKGHEYLAQAIKYVNKKDPSIKFVIFTQPKAKPVYFGLKNTLVITDFGSLDESDIYALYHSCDLYVQASLSEGFGLPVLEALSAGKPVVHPDYKPLTEITDERTSFRVPVKTITKGRDVGGILFLLHHYDPEEMGEVIINAKEEVIKRRNEFEEACVERAMKFNMWDKYKAFVEELMMV